jgi:hypothetical protein
MQKLVAARVAVLGEWLDSFLNLLQFLREDADRRPPARSRGESPGPRDQRPHMGLPPRPA